MQWLLGAALLPLLLCGLMCAGAVALAAVGLRRKDSSDKACCSTTDAATTQADQPREVEV